MRPSDRRYVRTLLLLGVALGAAAAAWGALTWAGLDAPEQAALARVAASRAFYLALLPLFLLAAAALVLDRAIRGVPRELRRAAEDVAVMLEANPAHRVRVPPEEPLASLARALNRLAGEHHAALARTEARVREATAALEAERNQLAAVLSDLVEGVVVCGADGQVALYNQRARELLEPRGDRGGGMVGLGRPLWETLERPPVERALDEVRARIAEGHPRPVAACTAWADSGRELRVRVAPVPGPEGRMSGFVVTLDALTDEPRPIPPTGSTHSTGSTESDSSRVTAETTPPAEPPPPARSAAPPRAGSRPEFYDFDLFAGAAGGLEERPLDALALTAFDAETTGLDPSSDRLVSLGAVHVVHGRILRGEAFSQRVRPGIPVPPAATAIHGLGDEDLRDAPPAEAVLPRFRAFAEGTVLLGHNAAFDLRFFRELEGTTGVRFPMPVLDTLLLSAVLRPEADDHALEVLASRFGVAPEGRHTALGDALLAAEVFLRMLPLLRERGIVTLGQALEASRRTALARLKY